MKEKDLALIIGDFRERFETGNVDALTEFVEFAVCNKLVLSPVGFFEAVRSAVEMGRFNVYKGLELVNTLDLGKYKINASDKFDYAGYRKFSIVRKEVENNVD